MAPGKMLDRVWGRLELNAFRQCAFQALLQHQGKYPHGLAPVGRSNIPKDRWPWVQTSPFRETATEHSSRSSDPTPRASISNRHPRSPRNPAASRASETYRQMQGSIQPSRQTEEG